MTEETTRRPELQQRDMGAIQQEMGAPMEQAMQMQQGEALQGVACPFCGAINEPGVMFCATCGTPLRTTSCPNCGSEIDPDADFCEVCHRYIRPDICSFCGASISMNDSFCPECGSPRGGIVCPTCHTLNDFAFCKQCGTPLTEEARYLVQELKMQPEYQEMVQLAREYDELTMEIPVDTEREEARAEECDKLRERVLKLLAQDKGDANPDIPKPEKKRMNKEELKAKKNETLDKLTELLERMAIPPMPVSAHVRNYAMAQKPQGGVRLAWVCNWKHAMHSSPCGCAKPQLGGKWVVLGHSSKQEIKDDK